MKKNQKIALQWSTISTKWGRGGVLSAHRPTQMMFTKTMNTELQKNRYRAGFERCKLFYLSKVYVLVKGKQRRTINIVFARKTKGVEMYLQASLCRIVSFATWLVGEWSSRQDSTRALKILPMWCLYPSPRCSIESGPASAVEGLMQR